MNVIYTPINVREYYEFYTSLCCLATFEPRRKSFIVNGANTMKTDGQMDAAKLLHDIMAIYLLFRFSRVREAYL